MSLGYSRVMVDLILRKNPDASRYEALVRGSVAGFAEYRQRPGGVVVLPHTVVGPEFEGQGVGSALAEYAVNDIAASGGSIRPLCPFIAAWIQRHPEYLRMVEAD